MSTTPDQSVLAIAPSHSPDPSKTSPRLTFGMKRLKARLFGSWWESGTTILCICLLGWGIVSFLRWAVFESVWTSDSAACANTSGACWSVIQARYRLILFGLYPHEEHWRSALSCFIVAAIAVLSCIRWFWQPPRLISLWLIGSLLFFCLMRGGVLGLSLVPTDQWGGLILTLVVFLFSILLGLPLGIVLALASQSKLPAIRVVTILVIDVVRSIPLLAVVFAIAFFLPFLLPKYLSGDKIYRVALGYAFFFACLQAQVISGGLQSIPAGQTEAAATLGLKRWQMIALVLLPQALKISLPAMINVVVMSFKDTSVLAVVGLLELTASGNIAYQSGDWNNYYAEVFLFIALIYFSFCYGLSKFGASLERRARVGTA